MVSSAPRPPRRRPELAARPPALPARGGGSGGRQVLPRRDSRAPLRLFHFSFGSFTEVAFFYFPPSPPRRVRASLPAPRPAAGVGSRGEAPGTGKLRGVEMILPRYYFFLFLFFGKLCGLFSLSFLPPSPREHRRGAGPGGSSGSCAG